MKKILVAIIAVLYMGTSIGATVQLHYCMGKLADWGIGHKSSATCNKCGMKKSAKKTNPCCKDEHKYFKNSSDQKSSESAFLSMQSMAAVIPSSYYEVVSVGIPSITENSPVSHAPPGVNKVAVYIRNCIFLI